MEKQIQNVQTEKRFQLKDFVGAQYTDKSFGTKSNPSDYARFAIMRANNKARYN